MRAIDINRVAEIIKNYAPQNDKSCKSIEQLLSESSFELLNNAVTISKDRYEQLLQYEQEYMSRQSMINSMMQNK